jgi:hypothetical protein
MRDWFARLLRLLLRFVPWGGDQPKDPKVALVGPGGVEISGHKVSWSYLWVGPRDRWNDPSNWCRAGEPGAGGTVTITYHDEPPQSGPGGEGRDAAA